MEEKYQIHICSLSAITDTMMNDISPDPETPPVKWFEGQFNKTLEIYFPVFDNLISVWEDNIMDLKNHPVHFQQLDCTTAQAWCTM